MASRHMKPQSRSVSLLYGAMAGLLVISIILFPERTFQASLNGLTLWWKLVFPALLPFLILSEIAIGFGAVHALGVLLDPVMRLLFKLPGCSGWAFAMGITVGYPAAADITGKLRLQRLLSRSESVRLLAVSHVASPMVMIGVIGVGFLHNPAVGLMIAIIQYLALFVVGIWMRLSHYPETDAEDGFRQPASAYTKRGVRRAYPVRVLSSMAEARRLDGRTFGKLLGDAVSGSLETLMLIGGFIMFFSVLQEIIRLTLLAWASSDWLRYAVPGLLEPHLGAYAVAGGTGFEVGTANISGMPLVWQAALIGAVLGWSGLSLHAQALGLVRSTDIRYTPFFLARVIHAGSAFLATFWLWSPLTKLVHAAGAAEAFAVLRPDRAAFGWAYSPTLAVRMLLLFAILLFLMLSVAAVVRLAYKVSANRK